MGRIVAMQRGLISLIQKSNGGRSISSWNVPRRQQTKNRRILSSLLSQATVNRYCFSSMAGENHNQKSRRSNNVNSSDNRRNGRLRSHRRPVADIQEAQNFMQLVLDRLHSMGVSPPTVAVLASDQPNLVIAANIGEDPYHDLQEILHETKGLFEGIREAVKQGNIHPSRKHGKELSTLVECILYNYSCCALHNFDREPSTDKTKIIKSLSQEIQHVLNTLQREWNLDIQNIHYQHAITVANQERNFKMASHLFERQIDPNAGSTPVPAAIDNPQGLYAIAKFYSQPAQHDQRASCDDQHPQSSSAAEIVMDAVQRMVMVSPRDQTPYVLAAGNALGYAGRWQDLMEYWKSSFLTKQWGAPLVVAVMQSCWLCDRHVEAWSVLEESNLLVLRAAPRLPPSSTTVSTTPGFGGEWQYGGEQDRMNPIVRDVAMKVVSAYHPRTLDEGSIDSSTLSVSELALDLYHQANDDEVVISLDAISGVVRACEQDGEWKEALSIFWSVLKGIPRRGQTDDQNSNLQQPWIIPGSHLMIGERDQSLPVFVKSVNETAFLGALKDVLISVMRACNASSNFGISIFSLWVLHMHVAGIQRHSNVSIDRRTPLNDCIQQLFSQLNDSSDILLATMVALCGLRCYKDAINLYQAQPDAFANRTSVELTYEHAKSNQARFGTQSVGNPWHSAERHITKLLEASGAFRSTNLDVKKREQILHLLGRSMNSATNSHQPELSLLLFHWTNRELLSRAVQRNSAIDVEEYNDFVTSEMITAYRWVQDLPNAISLFEKIVAEHGDRLSEWRMTTSVGLMSLVAGDRGKDAFQILKAMDDDALSTDCFTAVGKFLSKELSWKELINLYRDATALGFSSEDLGLMAMRAVISTKVDNRLRILRAIVVECASNAGVDTQTWTTNRYWHLKKELGFYYSRLLMWWNEEERAAVDELNLAIKEFYNEISIGLRPKNEVLRVIVDGASLVGILSNISGYEKVPKTTDQWVILLAEVLNETRDSPIHRDPYFVDRVVHAYESLGCSQQCVEYISEILNTKDVRIRRSTLNKALGAAQTENAAALAESILTLVKRKYKVD